MKIIIPTCDRYSNILEANKYTMDMFGGGGFDVTVLGYNKPDFDMGSWKFISLGKDTGAQNFSNDINQFFQDFDDEYFIYGNDDCVVVNMINHHFLIEIMDSIKSIPNFGRMWLTETPISFYGGGNIVKSFGNYNISEINQYSEYRLSLQYSIWKTSYFKKHLKPNLNPWEWETRGDAKNDGAAILLPVNNYVFNLGHVMKKNVLIKNWNKSIYDESQLSVDNTIVVENIFKKHGIL